jgi:hypothetical protein
MTSPIGRRTSATPTPLKNEAPGKSEQAAAPTKSELPPNGSGWGPRLPTGGAKGIDNSGGPKLETLKGTVKQQVVAKGSHSERTALVMTIKGKPVTLERQGGNPFMLDAKEKALIGKKVELQGYFVSDHLFRFTEAKAAK